VVRGVSIAIAPGELIGLVGPNGSGKTTTIRMLLDIIPADHGRVRLFGAPMSQTAQSRIGYLPEERGLYESLRVSQTLTYLAELKGVTRERARANASEILERVGMQEHAGKKIRELSRGMGQLIQFAATIIHAPSFIVLDEPFSGLDPVNARLMKDIMVELNGQGTSILFSTHQMTDVEELCENVVMINQGEVVLDGRLDEIKRRFADNAVYVETGGEAFALTASVDDAREVGKGHVVRLKIGARPETLLRELLDAGVTLTRYEIATPTLEEVFLKMVGADHA
jgi:ABC-2 type transport system ATP-binding protein